MVPEWGDLLLRLFAILLSSRAPTRDLHLRLSKAFVILTASDLFKRQEEVPHLRAGRQWKASDLFKRQEEIPHLRAGRQKETSVLFQTGEFASLEAFFCEYICASAAAMISSSLCTPVVRTAKP